MEEIEEDLNPDELCSRVFIKKKPYLAKLSRDILSWCKCGTNATEKGSLTALSFSFIVLLLF